MKSGWIFTLGWISELGYTVQGTHLAVCGQKSSAFCKYGYLKMEDSTRSSLKPSWLMSSWARSTCSCYPHPHRYRTLTDKRKESTEHGAHSVSRRKWTSYTKEMYFFKVCNFSSSLAGHLVLALPGLTAPGHRTTPPPLLKRNSLFTSSFQNTHLMSSSVQNHSGVLSHLPTLCTNSLCCWAPSSRGPCNTAPTREPSTRLVVPAAALSLGTDHPCTKGTMESKSSHL